MVYLAVFDLLISVTHAVDHLYWVARLNIAFESFCVVAGLLLQVRKHFKYIKSAKDYICIEIDVNQKSVFQSLCPF